MSQERIRAALERQLSEWADAQTPPLPVIWENYGTELPTGDHLRASLLPTETVALDLAGADLSYRGIFQVSVFTASGKGAGGVEQIARALAAEVFPPWFYRVSGGLAVRLTSPMSPRPAVQEPEWYSVPVTCRYAAEEKNRL